jgi:4-amino-4-deoxy-L-arabinose transferase-like glycosyltransferase
MSGQVWSESILQDRRAPWIVGAIALVLFSAANLPWQVDDYDQAKQAFTSFQMVTEGKWLYQETSHERIATKPPLVGWISAGSYLLTRSWDLAWRLPSMAAAAAIAVLLFRASKAAYGTAPAMLSLSALVLNLMSPRLASLVRTDMPLALVIFAIGVLVWQKVRTQQPWRPNDDVLIFMLLTAGMLIKGPVVLAFVLPGIAGFEVWRGKAEVRAMSSVWPWIASLLIFLLWVAGGIRFVPGFYDQVVIREFLGRFGGEVHRAQPLLFYVPHLLHKFAPWSLLMLGFGLVELRRAGWHRGRLQVSPETRWLICWSLGGLLLMSLLPSKRVDRIFPVIPPLCLLLGRQTATLAARSANLRTTIYQAGGFTVALALLFTGGYEIFKVRSAFREQSASLAEFARSVRHETNARNLDFAVVAAPDESLLLYLRKNRFVTPQRAVEQWKSDLDALVVSSRDATDVIPQLAPPGTIALRSEHRKQGETVDYILITKPNP